MPEPASSSHAPNRPDASEQTRRNILRAGAAAAGGAVVAAVATTPAQASPNDPLILGTSNSSGSLPTNVASTSTRPTFVIANQGSGSGALATSLRANGLAAGTYSPSGAGLSAANYSTTRGTGAAIAASGKANNGISATTDDAQRAAVLASNRNTANVLGIGGAVVASGQAIPALVATTHGQHDFAIYAFAYADQNEAESSNALFTYGDVWMSGDVVIEGDLYVTGTIYCDNVEPFPPERRVEMESRGRDVAERAGQHAKFVRESQ